MTEEMQKYESGLEPEKHNALAVTFNPFMEEVQGLLETAKTVKVTSVDDIDAMQTARVTRLGLKKIRSDVENTRKRLKESCLREGKAIDGMANVIKFVIVPVEEGLQEQENFIKRLEAERAFMIVAERTSKLEALGVDCQHFNLGEMSEDDFSKLHETFQLRYKATKEAEQAEARRIEAEKEAKEKAAEEARAAEKAERERIEAENAKLKAANLASQKKAQAELKKAELARKKLEAEKKAVEAEAERMKKEAQDRDFEEERLRLASEQAEKDAEVARLKAEKEAKQKALAAPDKDKLESLATDLCALQIPPVSSDVALKAVQQLRGILNGAVKCLRTAVTELSE